MHHRPGTKLIAAQAYAWRTHLLSLLCLLGACAITRAGEPLARREWKVDGVAREAFVYAPATAKTNATPVVFAFHGHGGTMHHSARTFSYHTAWPEAIVVYMQGLKTPGRLSDPEGKRPGWQHALGDQQDRDLKFFDAVLASLKEDYRVDEKRLYSTGHSNGGAFTYLLWAARGDRFAAFAPSGCAAAQNLPRLKPKPVLHVAGSNDPLVKFAWQETTINALLRLNECDRESGKKWEQSCTIYESSSKVPVVTFIHAGAHGFPAEAPALIVKFFKEHSQH
jgi:polyhydroxybutyrate depolymerase